MALHWYEKKGFQIGTLILGASISLLLVLLFPDWYHSEDVRIFIDWNMRWGKGLQGLREIYNTCTGCNYPILGIISTAGVFKLLSYLHIPSPIPVYRVLLAVVDGFNVLLIFYILKKLTVPNAAFWAGIAGLLVSSWAGGAVWSQMDGVSQFFILLTLAWMVFFNITKRIPMVLYLPVVSFLLACTLLTKQLIVFSFTALEIMLLANILAGRKAHSAAGYALLHAACLLGFLFVWDALLDLEGRYFSHLQLIWSARSGTAGTLSMNGFSVWIFLDQNMMRSSAFPLFPSASGWGFLTPQGIGIVLFAVLFLAAAVATVRLARKRHTAGVTFLGREEMFRFILLLAVVNLIVNVVMTGTHERYLYHFYPFLLIACLGLAEFDKRFSRALLVFVLIGANLYGWFVLLVLRGDIAYDYGMHKYVSVFHLALLAVLMILLSAGHGFFGRPASGGKTGSPALLIPGNSSMP